MSNDFKESQFELFPGETKSYSPSRPRYFWSKVSVSLENVIIVSIVTVLLMVVSYSLGVEKGKKIVRASLRSEIVKAKESITKQIESAYQAKYAGILGRAKQALIQARKVSRTPAPIPVQPEPAQQVEIKFVEPEKPQPKIRFAPPVMAEVQPAVLDPQDLKDLFTVQVASFKQEKFALEEANQLKGNGFEIFVLPKGKYSIVCVGKYSKKSQATAALSKLRKRYKDCIVRSL